MVIIIEFEPETERLLEEVAARAGMDAATYARIAVEEKLRAMPNSPAKGVPLDKLLEGLIGSVRSRDGKGISRLSELEWEAMADDLIEKRRQGHL